MARNIVGQPVTGTNLYGRKPLIDGMWERLDDGENLHILAPRRTGKSSIPQEMRAAPNENWIVLYITLEGEDGPAYAIAAMMSTLQAMPALRNWSDKMKGRIPYWKQAMSALDRVEAISTELFKVELRKSIGDEWQDAAEQFAGRLTDLPAEIRLLILLDELPILINRMIPRDGGKAQAGMFLEWFRSVRQAPDLQKRVQFVIAGSVGLPGVLYRHGLSAPINDLNAITLKPWRRKVAENFLTAVGNAHNFMVPADQVQRILDRIGPEEIVPFHLQLYFKHIRELAENDVSALNDKLIDEAYDDVATDTHMDHYATRLADLLPAEQCQIAGEFLAALCRHDQPASISRLLTTPVNDEVLNLILRLLEDDGYISLYDDQAAFRSPLLKSWWRKRRPARRSGDYA